jgi:large subunit ribosomal protein L9
MKLLLRKNVSKLGIVGDVVNVKDGYGRNYLIPQGLAQEPTDGNVRALAEARKIAERELAETRARLQSACERLANVEVTIAARANESGVLYGSVGRREIADALNALGHDVSPEHVMLREPMRTLDSASIDVRLDDDLKAAVKVWIVREKTEEELQAEAAAKARAAAAEESSDGDGAAQ